MFYLKLFIFYSVCLTALYYLNISPWVYISLGVALLLSFVPKLKGYACLWICGLAGFIIFLFTSYTPVQASASMSQVLAPTPTTFPTQVPISCETPKEYLACKVYQHEITPEQYDRMYKIIECESSWNPDAINTANANGTIDRGLVQINSIHEDISVTDMFDFKKSIDWMIRKVNTDGSFNAWSCNSLVN